MEEDNTKRSYSYFGQVMKAHECRKIKGSIDKIYDIISDCRYYSEWWPTTGFYGTVKHCTPETVGTKVDFKSSYGEYGSTITSAKKNDHLTFTYDWGIFSGQTRWSMKRPENNNNNNISETQINSNINNNNDSDSSNNNGDNSNSSGSSNSNLNDEETIICFDSELFPHTTKLKIYSNFVTRKEANSYFSPLVDAIESYMQKEDDKMYKRGSYKQKSQLQSQQSQSQTQTTSMTSDSQSSDSQVIEE